MIKPKLFVSYSRKDVAYLEEFKVQTAGLRRNNVVEVWTDQEIVPGNVWEANLKAQLESADIMIFLVSPDFIASDYIYDVEIGKAIERHNRGEVVIVPVIIRPCDFSSTPLTKFQALPKNAEPISKWENRDEAWMNAVDGLKRTIENANELKKESKNNTTENNRLKSDESTDESLKMKIANDIEAAINDLLKITKAKDNELHNSIIMQSGKFNRLKKEINNGTITAEQQRISISKIERALLSIVDELGLE